MRWFEERMDHRMRTPSFEGLRAASVATSRVKSQTHATDTRPELALRKALWAAGARYRLHSLALPGKPDIAFSGARVAVFCDGDFWHGRHWSTRRERLAKGANSDYWIAKIEYNMLRDRRQARELRRLGWRCIRVWETEVFRSPTRVATRIMRVVNRRLRQPLSYEEGTPSAML
jgi:DNA mismatch endonuclease (patch repair protein)